MPNDNYDAKADELEIIDLDESVETEAGESERSLEAETIRKQQNWRRQRRQQQIRWAMGSLCVVGVILLSVLLWPAARLVFKPGVKIPTPLPTSGIVSQIIAGNGVSYIMTNVPHQLSATLEAVRTNNGQHLWAHPVGTGLQQELVQDTLYLYSEAGVDAINVKNGRLRWSQNLAQLQGTPLALGDVLYVADGHGMDALRTQDGHIIWHQDDIGLILRNANGLLYTTSTDNKSIYAIHQNDGTILWHNTSVKSAQLNLYQSTGDMNNLYVVDKSNTSFGVLDPTTGNLLWHWQYAVRRGGEEFLSENMQANITQIAATSDGSIVAAGWHADAVGKLWFRNSDTLYVASVKKHTLKAINVKNGAVQWQRNEPGDLIGAGGGMLYSVTSSGDGIAALRARDGVEVWHTDTGKPVFIDPGTGMLYLQDADTLKALSAKDGHVLWQMPAGESVSIVAGGPVSAGGVSVIHLNLRASAADASGQIMVVQTADGDVVWSSQKNVTLLQEQDGTSYLRVATSGMIVAVEDKSGMVRWQYQLKGAKG